MKKPVSFAAVMAALSPFATLTADVHTWVGPEGGSWKAPGNFNPAEMPAEDDEVTIPAGVTVKINPVDDPDSWGVIGSLRRLKPLAETSRLQVTVPEGESATLDCAVNFNGNVASYWEYGTVVKLGGGELVLASTNRYTCSGNTYNYDYFTGFEVVEGSLRLPQRCVKPNYLEYGRLAVSNGATLFTASSANSGFTTYVRARQMFGEGLITNDCYTVDVGGEEASLANKHYLRPHEKSYSRFAGKIAGNILVSVEGRIDLTGTESTFGGSFCAGYNREYAKRIVGAAKIGNEGEPSSVGCGPSVTLGPNYGGYLLYLGAGETTAKTFIMPAGTYGEACYNTIDGGAYGGLVLTGNWNYRTSRENWYMANVVLTGSNSVPCEMRGTVPEYYRITFDGVTRTNAFFVTKRGTGTWRFSGERQIGGGFAVENGTLEFDSLAEANEACSLGKATMLTAAGTFGNFADMEKVPYAYTLGSANAGEEGLLRYTGAEPVDVATRPAVLKGKGGFVNDGTASFRYYGVSALDAGEKLLVLAGENTDENVMSDVTTGAEGAVLSVEKRGSGTWTLAGRQTFNGDLRVKEGTLKVRRPERYSWYKWVIKALYVSGERWTELVEFGLFDAEGNRCDLGLTFAENPGEIAPGETRIVTELEDMLVMTADGVSAPETVTNLMDDAGGYFKVGLTKSIDAESKDYYKPSEGNPATWVPVCMRLSDDAPAVDSFDWVPRFSSGNSNKTRTPRIYSVLGSMDGRTWDELFTADADINVYDVTGGYWKYSGDKYSVGDTRTQPHTGGQKIASAPEGYAPPDVLSNVRSVRVDPGATLELVEGDVEIASLCVDCAVGGGTVKGFSFAEEGTLDLINVPLSQGATDVMIGLSGSENWSSISGWTLTVDGSASGAGKYCFSVHGDRLRVVRRGLRFIVR